MDDRLIETDNLVTVKTFAKACGVTAAYIYKLKLDKQLTFVNIDGVRFVDILEHNSMINKMGKCRLVKKIKKLIKIIENEK